MLIYKLVSRNGIITRSELSRITDLSEAAVSKIVASLIENKILLETEFVKGIRGRRAIGLQVDNHSFRILSVHFARKYFAIGKFNLSGDQNHIKHFHFESNIAKDMIQQVLEEIKLELERDNRYMAIGVGVPGPYDMHTGSIMLMTETTGFNNISIKQVFEENFKLPVIITHDANAGAIASFDVFNDELNSNLVYYLVGQGVGAGVINHGTLIMGHRGIAGEIGHVSVDYNGEKCKCGNRGCLELYCSSLAIVNRALELREKHPKSLLNNESKVTLEKIVEYAELKDPLAEMLISEASYYISLGVINIIYAYNPKLIIIGDELVIASRYITKELKKVLEERGLTEVIKHTEIKFADLDVNYILKGVALKAIEESIINEF